MEIQDKKILMAGVTASLLPGTAERLAGQNEVWGLARFSDPEVRERLESQGVRTARWNKGIDSLDGLPTDFTHVIDAIKTPFEDFATAVRRACVGVGQLMTHCRQAEAFLFVSSTAVYTHIAPDHLYVETDPTTGYSPHDPPYAISKIAAEGTVQAYAETLGLPTVIARMNVAYGPHGWGGMPLHYFGFLSREQRVPVSAEGGSACMTPIHTDDVERQLPLLWAAASVPAPVVNWGGDEVVTEAELIGHIGQLCELSPVLELRAEARAPCAADPTRRQDLVGLCNVSWRDGVARAIEAHFPGSVVAPSEATDPGPAT
jgi:nucleoside-diphosphate-sugar epimerase